MTSGIDNLSLRKKLDADILKAKNWSEQLDSLNQKKQNILDQMGLLRTGLVSSTEIPNVLEYIFSVSKNSDIKVKKIEPISEELSDGYLSKKIKFELSGSYQNIGMFVNKIEQGPYLIFVRNFDLINIENRSSENLEAKMLIELYVQ